jgi:hypothetical protein
MAGHYPASILNEKPIFGARAKDSFRRVTNILTKNILRSIWRGIEPGISGFSGTYDVVKFYDF